jgi:hypothetical protein
MYFRKQANAKARCRAIVLQSMDERQSTQPGIRHNQRSFYPQSPTFINHIADAADSQ